MNWTPLCLVLNNSRGLNLRNWGLAITKRGRSYNSMGEHLFFVGKRCSQTLYLTVAKLHVSPLPLKWLKISQCQIPPLIQTRHSWRGPQGPESERRWGHIWPSVYNMWDQGGSWKTGFGELPNQKASRVSWYRQSRKSWVARDEVEGGGKFCVGRGSTAVSFTIGGERNTTENAREAWLGWFVNSFELVRVRIDSKVNCNCVPVINWEAFQVPGLTNILCFHSPIIDHLNLTTGKSKGICIPKERVHCCYRITVMA